MFGKKQQAPVVKACEHLWENPSAIADGKFAQKCFRCGECKGVAIPCSHSWADVVEVKPGQHIQTCKICKEARGVNIACAHEWKTVEGSPSELTLVQQCIHCKVLERKNVECKHTFDVYETYKLIGDYGNQIGTKIVSRCNKCGSMTEYTIKK